MATRAVRHAEALAKRERRLADERATALAAQRKDQEQRARKLLEAEKVTGRRNAKNQERLAAVAAAAKPEASDG